MTKDPDLESIFVALPMLHIKSDALEIENFLTEHIEVKLFPCTMQSLITKFSTIVHDKLMVYEDTKKTANDDLDSIVPPPIKEVRFEIENLINLDGYFNLGNETTSPQTETETAITNKDLSASVAKKENQASTEKPEKRVKSAFGEKEKKTQVYLLPQPSALFSKKSPTTSSQKSRAKILAAKSNNSKSKEKSDFKMTGLSSEFNPAKLAEEFGLTVEYSNAKTKGKEDGGPSTSRTALIDGMKLGKIERFQPLFK